MTSSDSILVDAHCHIDLFPHPAQVVTDAERRRIHVIAVTNAPSVFFHTRNLAQGTQFLHPAIGLHPELVKSHAHELQLMWKQLPETRFVGEIGLDYVTTDTENRQLQKQVFAEILQKCADSRDKVLSIHSRRSATDVIKMVGADFPGTIILHWFSGTNRELEQAIRFGFFFSVNPSMVSSKSGQNLIQRMPPEFVLTETDAPFVRVQNGPAFPHHVEDAIRGIADIWGRPQDDVRAQIERTFLKIIAPPQS